MTSSAYFMSKSVFDQQGCRSLTFALAMAFLYISASARRYAASCNQGQSIAT